MPSWCFPLVVIALLVFGSVLAFTMLYRRHHQDLSEYFVDALRPLGLKLVSVEDPGWFNVGPFPHFEWTSGGPHSDINGIRGEYNLYRIVTFSDSDGNTHRVWAKVEFEVFMFRQVRWRADGSNRTD